MTLQERQSFFERPKSKKAIIGDRNVIYVDSFEGIVPAHERRQANEVVVISPDVNLTPVDASGSPRHYSAQNFSKRGPVVVLNTFQGSRTREAQERALIGSEWSFLKARIDASEKYKNRAGERFIGWMWFDPFGRVHVIHPTTAIEGRRLYHYGLTSGSIEDITARPSRRYHARDSPQRVFGYMVPSRSEAGKERVLLEHMTDPNDPRRFVENTMFSTRHLCDGKKWDFTFAFPDRVSYCDHDSCAHYAHSVRVAEKTPANKRRIIDQPFPLFSEPTLRLHLGMIYDTMKIERVFEDGKMKFVFRSLKFAEIDPVEMFAWVDLGNKQTFYAGPPTKGYKRMRDYNWNSQAPGLSFSKYREGA